MLEEMLRAEAASAIEHCVLSKPPSAYPDIGYPLLRGTVCGIGIGIANKTKSRIESRDRTRTEARTGPWLESSVELKLEPRSVFGTGIRNGAGVRNQSGVS
ncbi:hypothetical protein EVAR_84721_1 [Eumeta japonica]|uniref:Uncharacterized protein n=1 Tax=Eumeta variegata TaxID=151549 RepID=A0A4C1VSR7_EUMVA|nr:hypothetical protein EVAR_84721_1 [Eumeta japonica]